jgi:type II secretory pathway component GspD/PulD (secretin)
MMKCIPLSVLFLAVLMLGTAQAETEDKLPIEIIELEHRSAHELLPHIEPLLAPRDSLTGMGYRLIVRTSPGRLRQIRELVAELDRPIRELRLTVSVQDSARTQERRLDPAREHEDEGGRVVRRHTTARTDSEQWVRVQDGQQAHIREGEIMPMAGTALLYPDGTLVGGVDYQTLDRGFVVTPNLLPDGRVRLHIAQIAERESPGDPGRVETRALETVVTVQPGEWVDLGGAVGQAERDDKRIIGTWRTRDRGAATVSVKVAVENDR